MYSFNGAFSSEDFSCLGLDDALFTWRDLRPAHSLYGVRFVMSESSDHEIALGDFGSLLIEAGVSSALVLSYHTWGGSLDHVFGFFIKDRCIDMQSRFDSKDLSEKASVELFRSQLQHLGVTLPSNGYFSPFERGYWGE